MTRPASCKVLALVLFFVLLGGPASDLAGQPRPQAQLRLGVMAEEPVEPDRILRIYGDLVGVLRKRLASQGIQVPGIVIARDVEDLARRLAAGEADFVIETVFPSLLLRDRFQGIEPALVVIRRGRREYRSVFFTRKDAPIESLEDLRGRTLVLQALRSTSAFALPKAELARAGIPLVSADAPGADPRAVRYTLAGAELNQGVWVLHGRGDAGAFNNGDWEVLPARIREQLRIFYETRPILRALLSVRSGMDGKVRDALESLLLELPRDPEGEEALLRATGITAFERVTQEDLEGLRTWEAILQPLASAP